MSVKFPFLPSIDVRHFAEAEDRQVYLQDDYDLKEALQHRCRDLESSQMRIDFTVEIEAIARRTPQI